MQHWNILLHNLCSYQLNVIRFLLDITNICKELLTGTYMNIWLYS